MAKKAKASKHMAVGKPSINKIQNSGKMKGQAANLKTKNAGKTKATKLTTGTKTRGSASKPGMAIKAQSSRKNSNTNPKVTPTNTPKSSAVATSTSKAPSTPKMKARGKIGAALAVGGAVLSAVGLGTAVSEYGKASGSTKAPAVKPPVGGSSGPTTRGHGPKSNGKVVVGTPTSVPTKAPASTPASKPAAPAPRAKLPKPTFETSTKDLSNPINAGSAGRVTPKRIQIGGIAGRTGGKWHLGRKVGKG